MSAARIFLLGPPHVLSGGSSKELRLPRKTLNLLAYLILQRRRPSSRDALAFALFPEVDEDAARTSLRQNLSYLLSSLPPTSKEMPFINVDGGSIAWNPEAPAYVDVIAFEKAVDEGRDDDAITAYGGALLPTLYDEWTTPERERLRDAFHAALVRTIARDRSRRRFDAATLSAHRLLDDDPWREDILRQLMAVRYESGDRAGALAVFEGFLVRLRDEMHVEPMVETVALRDAILSGARLATSEPRMPRLPASAATFALPFVGRDAAMEAAIEQWHLAADGSVGLLFVGGEAGIGKSRFVTELARTVESEGGRVIRGETTAGGEQRPYEAFVDALKAASLLRRDANPSPTAFDELPDEQARVTLADDRSARVRLFDSVRRAIAHLAHARPVCVILEDLHWAGPATVDLFGFVAIRSSEVPVLLIATFRSDELLPAHPLRSLARQFEGRTNVTTLSLQRLEPQAAAHALRVAAPPTIDDDALARTVAWADGVPLLLAEALRDLAAGRAPATGNIATLVGERFARLSERAETALIYGAVLGTRFELATLAAITGWRDDEIVEALSESINLGLIRATTRSPGLAFSFSHHLIRAAAIERVPPQDLVRAHALAARALVMLPGSGGARAFEVGRQLQAAGDMHGAARQLLHAASYALDVFANQEARDAATSGLALLLQSGNADAALQYALVSVRERALERIGVLSERRADALELVALAGDDPERACAAWERVFEAHKEDAAMCDDAVAHLERLSGASPNAAAIYERAVAARSFLKSDYSGARDAASRAAEHFERGGDSKAAIRAHLDSIAALGRLAEFEMARAALERLHPLAEAEGDLALLATFHRVACSAADERHRGRSLEHAKHSLELALRIGDRYEEARAHQNVAVFAGKMRDIEGALREHGLALQAYRDVGDEAGIADTLLNLATVRGFSGDHVAAEALLDDIVPAALRQPWLALRLAMNRAAFSLRARRYGEAEREAANALAQATALGTHVYEARALLLVAEVAARTGKSDAARQHLDIALSAFASLGQPALQAEALAISSRLHAGQGDAQAARADAATAHELAQRFAVQHFGETAWHLAAAHALLGDADAAMRFAEAAVRAFVENAMRMPADLVDAYARLPWHRHAFEHLAGRPTPLRFDECEAPENA